MAHRYWSVLAAVALGAAILVSTADASQTAGDSTGAKRPGVIRIGVATNSAAADSIRQELIALLQGDGSLIEVVPLTNRIEAFRLAEARKRECDFILDATFEPKAKSEGGSLISRLTRATGVVNKESGNFDNTQTRKDDVDRKTASVDNIAKELAPTPKDKVRVAYRLIPTGAAKPVLTDDKEIVATDLPAYLETFLNDVVTTALK